MPSQRIIRFAGVLLVFIISFASSLHAQEPTSLPIDEAVRLALSQNPTLAAIRADTAAARARIDAARSGGLPQISVGAQYTHITSPGTFTIPSLQPNTTPVEISVGSADTLVGTITAQQALYTGGRVGGQISQAEANYDAALARQGTAEAQIAQQAREAYYGVLLGESSVTSASETLAAAQKQSSDAQSRFEAGVAARFDVLRAQTSLSEAQQNVTQARNQVENARLSLNRVIGVPQTSSYTLTNPELAPLPSDNVTILVETAERQRAEVLGSRAQVAASEAGISIARAEGHPEIDVSANYQAVSNASSVQGSGWTFLISGNLSLFNGGKTRADVAAATSLTEQSRANLTDTLQAVEQDVRQAYLNVQTARTNIDTATARLAQAADAYDVATVRYQAGVGTATELADALAQLASARTNLDGARYNYNIAYARLQRALGFITY